MALLPFVTKIDRGVDNSSAKPRRFRNRQIFAAHSWWEWAVQHTDYGTCLAQLGEKPSLYEMRLNKTSICYPRNPDTGNYHNLAQQMPVLPIKIAANKRIRTCEGTSMHLYH